MFGSWPSTSCNGEYLWYEVVIRIEICIFKLPNLPLLVVILLFIGLFWFIFVLIGFMEEISNLKSKLQALGLKWSALRSLGQKYAIFYIRGKKSTRKKEKERKKKKRRKERKERLLEGI